MYLLIYLSTLFGSLFAHKPDASAGPPLFLNVTTIAARDCHSILECWQLDSPFKVPSTPGVAGASAASLGPAGGNLSYTILPPHFDGGLHTAPMVQYVSFVAGLVDISLPTSDVTARVHGGRGGLILAADVSAVSADGHTSEYPSDEPTIAISIPTPGGEVPGHRVLHDGPCSEAELPP